MTSITPEIKNKTTSNVSEAKLHFINVFNELADFFIKSETVGPIEKSFEPIEEAIVKITIGQMLSRKAAASIYNRAKAIKDKEQYEYTMELPENMLASCGISSRKIQTIKSFYRYWKLNKKEVLNWHELKYECLKIEIKRNVWGFADWSIAMLAIFYFGHQDVFPSNDGTLKRALSLIQDKYDLRSQIHVEKASPFASYLALYLWQAIDREYLSPTKNREHK